MAGPEDKLQSPYKIVGLDEALKQINQPSIDRIVQSQVGDWTSHDPDVA